MKHIMIMFLSDVKVKNQQVEETPYDEQGLGVMHTTNESSVKFLLKELPDKENFAKIFAFTTPMVQEPMKLREVNHVTHLEYFCSRIQPSLAALGKDAREIVVPVQFDDSLPPDALTGVVFSLADAIHCYLDALGDEAVTMHADMTGGPRNASMLMIGLMRLMQYSGVALGRVLYSNYRGRRVEDVSEVYRLFDLVAGAEEFANFGSVKTLNKYYEQRQFQEEVGALLKAMHCFSEEIQLCRYEAFTEAIEALRRALEDFSAAYSDSAATVNARSLYQMLRTIRRSYEPLLWKERTDLELIEWCIEHGYLQQAMTLYTERIPECVVGEKKMITLTERQKKIFKERLMGKKEEEEEEERRSENFLVFSVYKPEKEANIANNQIQLAIHAIVQSSVGEEWKASECGNFDEGIPRKDWQGLEDELRLLNELLERYLAELRGMGESQALLLQEEQCSPFIRQLIQSCREYDQKQLELGRRSADKCYMKCRYGKQRYKRLLEYLQANISSEQMYALFGGSEATARLKAKQGARRLRYLAEEDKITVRPEHGEMLFRQAEIYAWVKDERNNVNHARASETVAVRQEVVARMREGIRLLREVK